MERFVSLIIATCLLAVVSVCSAVSDPHVSITWQDATGAGGQWSMAFEVGHDLRTGDAKAGSVSLFSSNLVDYPDLAGSGLNWFNMGFDVDPFVSGGFAVTNGTGSVMTFTIIFTSPVAPSLAAPTLYGGSMGGSFSADDTPVTVATAAQTPLYWGMIDGTPLLPFYDDPSSWSAAAYGSGDIDAMNAAPRRLSGRRLITPFPCSLSSP